MFEKIDRPGSKIRRYKNIAIVVGERHMTGKIDGAAFTVRSRYTHVYFQLAGPPNGEARPQVGPWLMVSGQGTPIS